VYNQEPQLFWLSSSTDISGGGVRMNFLVNDPEELTRRQNELINGANAVMRKVNAYTGAVSKVKAIYDHIVLGNQFTAHDFDDSGALVIEGEGWSGTAYNGVLGKGDGLQCSGYAKTFQYLCDYAGISGMVITGVRPDGITHAWNKLYVENGWYNLDATFGDPVLNHAYYGADYIRYNFFLVPDAWITASHLYPSTVVRKSTGTRVTYFAPPVADKTSCNYFKVFNKEYSTLDDAAKGLYAEFDEALKAKRGTVHIRVTDKSIYDTLLSDAYRDAFTTYAKQNGGATLLERQRTYSEGILVVQYNIRYN
jgi:hypothetical protein